MLLDTVCLGKLEVEWHGPFCLANEEIDGLPAGLPGVYLLAAFTGTSSRLEVFYAGESGDLRRRLGEHTNGKRTVARYVRDRVSVYFYVATISHALLRSAAEGALIRRFMPAGNFALPRVPAVDVNSPELSLLALVNNKENP